MASARRRILRPAVEYGVAVGGGNEWKPRIAAAALPGAGRRRRRRRTALQPLHLLIELLIAVLQFLHRAGEIADRLLEAVEAGHQIARCVLRMRGRRRRHA